LQTPIRRPFGQWAARGAAVFCAGFALFQASLALGAPFGRIVWGGSSAVLPPGLRWASLGAAAYLLAAAAIMEVRAGDWGRGLPRLPFLVFNVILAAQLALNTAANLAAQTQGERFGMGAASAVGCVLSLWALRAGRPEP
jgi:hypothetical protein